MFPFPPVAVYAKISTPSGPGIRVLVISLRGEIWSGGDVMCSSRCAAEDDQDVGDVQENESAETQRDMIMCKRTAARVEAARVKRTAVMVMLQ